MIMPDTTARKTTKQNHKTVFFMVLPEHMAGYHQQVRVKALTILSFSKDTIMKL